MLDEKALRHVVDELAIRNLVCLYPLSLDRRRFEGLREMFSQAIEADFTRAGRREVYRGPAEGWIADIAGMVRAMDATQHQLGNLRVELDGDTARASCSFLAMHVLHNDTGSSRYDVIGFYDFALAREPAGWRVRKYAATKDRGFGNPHIFRIAAARAQGGGAQP